MQNNLDKLKIGDRFFDSRLMLGTGKYKTTMDAIESIQNSECEIVTVAIRRLPTEIKNDSTVPVNKNETKKILIKQHF